MSNAPEQRSSPPSFPPPMPPLGASVPGPVRQNPRSRRGSRRKKSQVPWVTVSALAALFVLLVISLFSLYGETTRYETLLRTRQDEAQRLQARRDEHLSARRNSGLMPLIQRYAAQYGVEPALISAVIKNESSFNPLAQSGVGAWGLMQIMPDTGIWLAQRMDIPDYTREKLFDPEFNIRMGTYYLAYLSDIFEGSPVMVAAAFHAGDNNVKRWALDRAPDKRTLTLDMIPTDDTRSYVRKVMDAYAIYYSDQVSPKGGMPAAVPAAAALGLGAGG